MTPNPYTDTTVTRCPGGKVRVDTPTGSAVYDCTRLDQFDRFPLVIGSSNTDRRAAVNAYIATLGCEAFVQFRPFGTYDDDDQPEAVACGRPAAIFLDGGTDTMPVCEHHR